MTSPTRKSATDRIAAGHASNEARPHLGARIASAYRYDAEAERLLALRESHPEAYAALPSSTRTGLAYYSGSREAARALGVDVSAPTTTP